MGKNCSWFKSSCKNARFLTINLWECALLHTEHIFINHCEPRLTDQCEDLCVEELIITNSVIAGEWLDIFPAFSRMHTVHTDGEEVGHAAPKPGSQGRQN